MLNQPVRSLLAPHRLVLASPSTTVSEAASLMAQRRVGAVLVVDDERLLGIFSERDAVCRVVARGLEPATTPLAEVMTPSPVTIAPERSFGHALTLMQQHHCRHLPVIDNGRPIGIVSARHALDPELEEFVCEERRRQRFACG